MQDDYIESRLDPQIKYYDKRSTRCHNEHNYLSIFGIILTAAIPPLTLLSETAPIMKQAIRNGSIIEDYPDDYPYPSCLILGYAEDEQPLHLVCGAGEGTLFIITAYRPSPEKWEADWKTRKEKDQ